VSFRYLISWWRSAKIHVHLSLLYALAVTLHSIGIIFTLRMFIDTFDSCHYCGSEHDSMKIPTTIQYCVVWWNLLDKPIWSHSLLYWEYKLVRSVFLFFFFQNKMNEQIKVLSIAAYYFFPSLRQFSNSTSKKWLVFGGDSILEPIFDFCERSESVTCCILRNNQ